MQDSLKQVVEPYFSDQLKSAAESFIDIYNHPSTRASIIDSWTLTDSEINSQIQNIFHRATIYDLVRPVRKIAGLLKKLLYPNEFLQYIRETGLHELTIIREFEYVNQTGDIQLKAFGAQLISNWNLFGIKEETSMADIKMKEYLQNWSDFQRSRFSHLGDCEKFINEYSKSCWVQCNQAKQEKLSEINSVLQNFDLILSKIKDQIKEINPRGGVDRVIRQIQRYIEGYIYLKRKKKLLR